MAFTYYEIPLRPAAQKFNIQLAGVVYQLTMIWRAGDQGGWFLDIALASGAPVVQGIPLITGADLLEQYPDKNFGGVLRVTTDSDPDAPPTYGNLGLAGRVYFGVES